MLLLGAGGAGKTSALVGCLCHLMNLKSGHSKPLLPIFMTLPSVGPSIHQPAGLDRHLQAQLRLDDETFKLLPSETRVVLLLDSLDEVALHPETGASILATKLLDMNPWCCQCKVIVSCRTELLDAANVNFDTALHNEAKRTLPYHVWPFSDDDRQTFMQQAAVDRIAELARREAQDQYTKLRDTFQLTDDQLSHPCVLRIATKVLSVLKPGENELHNMYTLYDNFVRSSLSTLDEASQDLTICVLQRLAFDMSQRKVWHVPVREVHERLSSVEGHTPEKLLHLIPSRCEDLHNPNVLWGFWHKTVSEFLAAQAMKDDINLAASAGPTDSATFAGMDQMAKLAEALDTYVFVPNPDSIRETMERLLRQKSYSHIDMSPIEIPLEELCEEQTDSGEVPQPLCAEWINKHLLGLVVELRALRITLPAFTGVTHLASMNFGHPSWRGCVTLDVRRSFPNVSTFAPNFEIKNTLSVVWPTFPLVEKLPDGFVAHVESFPLPEQFCNVEEIGENINFSLTEDNAGLRTNSYLKVKKVPLRCCLSVKRGRCITLPKHWQSTHIVKPEMTTRKDANALAVSLLQGERPTTIDLSLVEWVPCPVNNPRTPDVLTFINEFQYPLTVIMPHWPDAPASASTIGCFGFGERLDLEFVPSNPKLRLIMTHCFAEVERVRDFKVMAETLLAPLFSSVREISDTGGTSPRWNLNASIVEFPADAFEKCTLIGNHVHLDGAGKLTLPRFSAVMSVGDGFLCTNSASNIVFPNDALPNCTSIGCDFMKNTQRLEEFNFPLFLSVQTFRGNILRGSALKRVSFPARCLDNCTNLGQLLSCTPNIKKLSLPRFSSLRTIDDSFLAGSHATHIIMPRDAFPDCTHVGSDFLRDTKNLERFDFPMFPSVVMVGGNTLRQSGVHHVHFPPHCLEACTTIGVFFRFAPNLHQVDLPPLPSVTHIVAKTTASPSVIARDRSTANDDAESRLRLHLPQNFLPLITEHQRAHFLLILENSKNTHFVDD